MEFLSKFIVSVKIGEKAPNIKVSKWIQGLPTNFDKEKDQIIVVEVFQVNCPGCFMYGIPEAIEIYKKYHAEYSDSTHCSPSSLIFNG